MAHYYDALIATKYLITTSTPLKHYDSFLEYIKYNNWHNLDECKLYEYSEFYHMYKNPDEKFIDRCKYIRLLRVDTLTIHESWENDNLVEGEDFNMLDDYIAEFDFSNIFKDDGPEAIRDSSLECPIKIRNPPDQLMYISYNALKKLAKYADENPSLTYIDSQSRKEPGLLKKLEECEKIMNSHEKYFNEIIKRIDYLLASKDEESVEKVVSLIVKRKDGVKYFISDEVQVQTFLNGLEYQSGYFSLALYANFEEAMGDKDSDIVIIERIGNDHFRAMKHFKNNA